MTRLGCADTNLGKVFLPESSVFSMRRPGTAFTTSFSTNLFLSSLRLWSDSRNRHGTSIEGG